MDRIIILPKEAIRRIVSFLSAKEAVFTSITSILSKKETVVKVELEGRYAAGLSYGKGLVSFGGNIRNGQASCIPTLQRLVIQDFHPSQFTRVTLDTPSLTYLECSDAMPDEYSIVNLDSLVEAKLHLMFTGGQYQYYIPYDGSGPLHYNEEQPESVCNCLLGYSFLLSCPTKVLQITDYRGQLGRWIN
ncbi:hypothetical protein DY000_02048947 [Brassica cretica]|uniref:F-box domain-containing protein n=1 Tax=Brassica cretica TaxID=69181 RepID=A0ABQ7EYL0_BRACR|nr:hypothetical protein DY000_02048947 [Brassica cretica]